MARLVLDGGEGLLAVCLGSLSDLEKNNCKKEIKKYTHLIHVEIALDLQFLVSFAEFAQKLDPESSLVLCDT